MKITAPIETKVTASSGAALLAVAALAALNHWVPGFRPVAPYVAPAVAWLATLAAGYLAPHTHLRPEPVHPLTLTLDQVTDAAISHGWYLAKDTPTARITAGAADVPPAVQPPAATIGAAAVQLPATTTGATP